jgi:putative membrane protein
MEWLIGLIITTLVVALGLLVISKLPIGVEIDSLTIAIVSALVFGLLNGLFGWLTRGLAATIILAPIAWILNIIIFGVTAKLIEGFRLTNGLISAALGAFALAIVTSVTTFALEAMGILAGPAGKAIKPAGKVMKKGLGMLFFPDLMS